MAVKRKNVEACTGRQVTRLLSMPDGSAQRAALAKLRRGIGQAPGAIPELWAEFLSDMDEEMYSENGDPTYAEWAVYMSLTLFALHQQGSDPKLAPMSLSGQSLGKAVALLIKTPDDLERIRRRFNTLATSESTAELSNHLRSMVQLLKAGNIALDYPALAGDIFDFQFIDRRDGVKLRWGQDFYRTYRKNNTDSENEREDEIYEED